MGRGGGRIGIHSEFVWSACVEMLAILDFGRNCVNLLWKRVGQGMKSCTKVDCSS